MDVGKCGRLRVSPHGVRGAAFNRHEHYPAHLATCGFSLGRSVLCVFHHEPKQHQSSDPRRLTQIPQHK